MVIFLVKYIYEYKLIIKSRFLAFGMNYFEYFLCIKVL